jgi:hypothetical protein
MDGIRNNFQQAAFGTTFRVAFGTTFRITGFRNNVQSIYIYSAIAGCYRIAGTDRELLKLEIDFIEASRKFNLDHKKTAKICENEQHSFKKRLF